MRLIVTRPRRDSDELAASLRAGGHTVIVEPLLEIVPRPVTLPALGAYQGLLVTSANGIRCLAAPGLEPACLDLPVYAVGDASGNAARDAGFANVKSASGDLEALTELVCRCVDPAAGPLAYPTGSKVAGDLKGQLEGRGYAVDRHVLYDAVTADGLAPGTLADLQAGNVDGVLLFSPRTAAVWADVVTRSGLMVTAVAITSFCLSQAVADRLHAGFSTAAGRAVTPGSLRIAATPDMEAMLALVNQK